MRRILLSIVFAGMALLSACSPVDDETSGTPETKGSASPPSPAPSASAAGAAEWSTCRHPEGVVVSYPADWNTNAAGVLPHCSAFDPELLQNEGRESFDSAILTSVEDVDFAAVVEPDATSGEVVDRRETVVDGHDAVRIESRSEPNPLAPEGMRSTRWFVVFGRDRTLSLVAHDVGPNDDYESEQKVLDEMVSRLQLPADL
jgi:hypothetical protein